MTDQKGKPILSNKDANNNGLKNKEVLTFDDLPSVLLEVILSFLVLKDNIRAAAVCKAWRRAAEFVRVVGKHPWVITFPERGDLVVLFDPLERKRFELNLPEIAGSNVWYSKDGWLLMRRSSSLDMFFFNPYTRELINLPKGKLTFQAITFSSAPTSGTCTVLAIKPFTKRVLHLSILSPRETEWKTQFFYCSLGFDPSMHSNLVYANDRFYSFSLGGALLEIDPASHTLNLTVWKKHKCPYIHDEYWIHYDEYWRQPKRIYLTEHKGELFLMYTCGIETPLVYKLVSSNWEEISSTNLEGLTIFASLHSSEMRSDVLGMRNSVYFPKYGLHYKRCVSYSFDDERYYPRKLIKPTKISLMPKDFCPLRSLWIEPPSKNVLDSMCEVK